MSESTEVLEAAFENLINVKIADLLKPDGRDRFQACFVRGIVGHDLREARKRLREALNATLKPPKRG